MSFKDISEKCFTPEQIESINFISATGIMNGYTDGSFRPHNNLTNAELCKILYEIIATDSQEAPSFPQTYITDHWAAQYINFVLNEFPPIAKCEYNCIFPAKCELKSWSDEPSSSQYSRKLFNLLFTQYSTFKIQEISDKIITRLEISEWIYQFAKSIWSEQKETDSWEDLVCEWGEKSFNQKYHLNLYLFFLQIAITS